MALQVWLPLNGDLKNNGLLDITITNNNAVVDNTGKIGKCFLFNGIDNFLSLNNLDVNNWPQLSICFWCYPIESASYIFLIRGGGQHRVRVSGDGFTFRDTRNTGNQRTIDFGTNIPNNVWTHITCIYNHGEIFIYINGNLTAHNTSYYHADGILQNDLNEYRIGRTQSTSGNSYYSGKLNDFRIYNHALSVKEVKEISKELVLHYKLDGNGSTSTQIISTNVYNQPIFNTSAAAGGWSHWGSSGHVGSYGQNTDKQYIYNKNHTYSHWVADGSTATKDYLCYQSPAFDGGNRSLQFIVKEENGLPITEAICYPAWNARNGGTVSNKWTSIQYLGDGFYYCKCEGISQDGSNDLIGIYVKIGYKIYISEAYLENDVSICTLPFIYNDNIVYDTSGYGNDCAITQGSLQLNTDTPRYLKASIWNNTKGIISTNFTGSNLLSEFTWSGWVRRTYTDTNDHEVQDGFAKIWFKTYNNNNFLPFISWTHSTGDNAPTNSWVTGEPLPYDTWVHIAWTFKNGVMKHYRDGQYKSTSDRSSTGQYIKVNRTQQLGASWQGCLSDIRIYTTELSAEDIKELYNTPAFIDNKQNLSAYELIEDNSAEVRKTGILEANEFIEDEVVEIYDDGQIKSNTFYEI